MIDLDLNGIRFELRYIIFLKSTFFRARLGRLTLEFRRVGY